MSRIIKFRAWDGKYKKMRYKVCVGNVHDEGENYTAHTVYLKPGDTDYKIEPPGQWMHFDEHSDFTLMQFTGLLDKNRKDIYEGDILLFWKGFNETYREYTGEVKWHQQAGSWYVPCGKFYQDIVGFAQSGDGEIVTLDNAEVIGNIYETPSLIKL